MIKIACRRVSLALVQAECLEDQINGFIPRDRVAVPYNAINTKELDALAKMDPNPDQVLFIGQMTQAKGYYNLIRAIPLVARKILEVRFLFTGTLRLGERGFFFNQTTGKPLEYENPFFIHDTVASGPFRDNSQFLGMVKGYEKLKLIGSTSIFVFPFYSESFSRALLVCMSAGKPVLCTLFGAHREVVRHGVNRYIVEPGDITALAHYLVVLLRDYDLRSQVGKAKYLYTRESYDIFTIGYELANHIDGVIHD